ncbi:hypothetical protein ASD03_18385 [Ensifer sp. Root127]|nr:hypothetical protein ASD03_18385 [Ensifer sp. Root127]
MVIHFRSGDLGHQVSLVAVSTAAITWRRKLHTKLPRRSSPFSMDQRHELPDLTRQTVPLTLRREISIAQPSVMLGDERTLFCQAHRLPASADLRSSNTSVYRRIAMLKKQKNIKMGTSPFARG